MDSYTGNNKALSIGDTTKIVIDTKLDLTGNTALKIYLYTKEGFESGAAYIADLAATVKGQADGGLIEAPLAADTFSTEGEHVARSYVEFDAEHVLGDPVSAMVTRGK